MQKLFSLPLSHHYDACMCFLFRVFFTVALYSINICAREQVRERYRSTLSSVECLIFNWQKFFFYFYDLFTRSHTIACWWDLITIRSIIITMSSFFNSLLNNLFLWFFLFSCFFYFFFASSILRNNKHLKLVKLIAKVLHDSLNKRKINNFILISVW